MKSRTALVALVAIVVIAAIVLLAGCVLNAGKTPAVKSTAIPAAPAAEKTNIPAPTSMPQPTAIPTATLPPPLNADELFARGTFPGILPEFARDNAVGVSERAGDSFTTSNGTNIGSDLGWNQPFYGGEWTKFLCYQTAWCLPPGQSVTFTMQYKTVILNPADTNWNAPYNSWFNASLMISQERPEFSGKFVTSGVALTAPLPLTIAIDYGAGVCEAPSAALVTGPVMTVTLACPSNSAVECIFSVGQWGEFVDLQTGQKADAEVQKYGGNIAVPGCNDTSFPGPYQWLQSLR